VRNIAGGFRPTADQPQSQPHGGSLRANGPPARTFKSPAFHPRIFAPLREAKAGAAGREAFDVRFPGVVFAGVDAAIA